MVNAHAIVNSFGSIMPTLRSGGGYGGGGDHGGGWHDGGVTPPIPEPEECVLMLAGLGVVGFIARRRLRLA